MGDVSYQNNFSLAFFKHYNEYYSLNLYIYTKFYFSVILSFVYWTSLCYLFQ